MVHSRIKVIHTKEDATPKQKTIRSHSKLYLERTVRTQQKQTSREYIKVVIIFSRRSNCVEDIQKGRYCSLPKKRTREGGLPKKVSRRSKSNRKGKGFVEPCAKKFAEESDASRK